MKNNKSVGQQVAERDFSIKTLRNLKKKNITLVGVQGIPDLQRGWAFAERTYKIIDNGVGRVKTFQEILDLGEH